MGFLKNFFGRKDVPIQSYADFWSWFQKNEKRFFTIVKNGKEIEKFFDQLSPKLTALKEGYFYLTGMFDDNTVELVLTAEGNTKTIAFVEELVAAAPKITGWEFTALKPALNIENVNIKMAGYEFNDKNISFYANEFKAYPDEINITVTHNDLTENNKVQISNGIYIFLDNFLGELDFVNNVDNIKINSIEEADKELIPIAKLKDFLTWRQREFIEKYEEVRYNTENDSYASIEAELSGGDKLFAIINRDLLGWDSKASHPWISVFTIKYDGSNSNGMPTGDDYNTLNIIEDEIMHHLKDIDGYLNIGRQTSKGKREIYFACKDFRTPSKVFFKVQQEYSKSFEIEYDIYKDKYWQSFERFSNTL